MKKALAALVILSMLLSAVALAEAESAAGVWYLTEMMEDGQSFNPADLGMTISLTLEADGTATMDTGDAMVGTWEQNGDTVTVTIEDQPSEFTLAEGLLTAEEDGLTMVFSQEAVEGFVPAAAVEAATPEDFNGSWQAYKVGMMGLYIDVEQMGETVTADIENSVVTLGGSMFEDAEDAGDLEFAFVDGTLNVVMDEESGTGITIRLLEDGNLELSLAMDAQTSFEFYMAPVAAAKAAPAA